MASSATVQARPYTVHQTTPRTERSLVLRNLCTLWDECSRLVCISTQDEWLEPEARCVLERAKFDNAGFACSVCNALPENFDPLMLESLMMTFNMG